MNVTIIGTGFVGVVTAGVLSSFGNKVYGLDIDEAKVASLKQGKVPFFEPGLEEILVKEQAGGNLQFTTNYKTAIENADIIMIAVGTPSTEEGKADLTYVMAAAESLSPFLKENAIVVVKSTVPPGTLDEVEKVIKHQTKVAFHMASVPEFLKEGAAIADCMHPDRIVIGAEKPESVEALRRLYDPFVASRIQIDRNVTA